MTALELKNFNRRTLKKCRVSLWLCGLWLVSLALVKLALSNRASTWGREVERITQETAAIRAANEEKKLRLNQQLGGLEQLKETALAAGYTEKPRYLYLSVGESVAQLQP